MHGHTAAKKKDNKMPTNKNVDKSFDSGKLFVNDSGCCVFFLRL